MIIPYVWYSSTMYGTYDHTVWYVPYSTCSLPSYDHTVRTYCNKQRTSEQKEGKRKRYRYTLRRTQTLPRLFIFCTQDVDSMVVGRGTKEEARWVLIVGVHQKDCATLSGLGTEPLSPTWHQWAYCRSAVCCTVQYCTVSTAAVQYC